MVRGDYLTQYASIIGECLEDLLKRPVLEVAIRQRAKFEGWLKIELAYALEKRGASVKLEAELPREQNDQGLRVRADIQAKFPGDYISYIMIKTNNTNFRFPDIVSYHRPITKNITKTIEDLDKLRPISDRAIPFVVFPFFPVAASAEKRLEQVSMHLTRLLENGRLVKEGFVIPPSSSGDWGIAWYIVSPIVLTE